MARKLLCLVYADQSSRNVEVDGWAVEDGAVLHTWLEQFDDLGRPEPFGDVWRPLSALSRWYWADSEVKPAPPVMPVPPRTRA